MMPVEIEMNGRMQWQKNRDDIAGDAQKPLIRLNFVKEDTAGVKKQSRLVSKASCNH